MSILSPIYGRRRRPTFIILVVFVVIVFLYTTNRMFNTSSTSVPSAPIPPTENKPAADPAPNAPPKEEPPKQEPPKEEPPKEGENKAQEQDKAKDEENDLHMEYGIASRPGFEGYGALTKLGQLPAEHRPAPGNNKRLIFVGDVHGMIDPLQNLLSQVSYDAESGRDHLVFLGNMVTEGPDSAAVVELARTLKASGVRGIHEDRVLIARGDMNATVPERDSFDTMERQHLSHGDYTDTIVAESLTPENVEYLRSFPVILELGNIPTLQNAFVAHAGLVPGLELERQDPWPAMHMRSVLYPRVMTRKQKAKKKIEDWVKKQDEEKTVNVVTDKAKQAMIDEEYEKTKRAADWDVMLPVDDYSGEDWAKAWNEIEGARPEAERRTVFYGHDTRKGLNVAANSVGLNTKCVYGGQLSAFIVTGAAGGVEHETVQVECEEEAKLVDDE